MPRLGKNFWLLWSGFSVSTVGTYLSLVVVNLYIYDLTHSALLVGVFMFVRLVPAFFMGNIAGVLADKFERKYLIIIADLVRAALIFSIIFLKGQVLPLYFIIFFVSVFSRLYQSALGGGIPNIVGSKNMVKANSYLASGRTIALMTGPVLGGLLISSGSYKWAFGIDALTYLFSAAVVWMMSCKLSVAVVARTAVSFWSGIKEGYGFVFARAGLLSIILLRCLDGFGSSALNVGLPIFTSGLKNLTPGLCYGLMFASLGFGEMLGALIIARTKFVQNAASEMVVGVTILVMAVAFGFSLSMTHLYPAMFFLWICGLAEGVTTVTCDLKVQRNPDEIRGRVVGLLETSVWSSMGVGMFLSGFMAEHIGITRVVQIFAALIAVGCLIHLVIWKFKFSQKEIIAEAEYVPTN